jgi:hypothetical protein
LERREARRDERTDGREAIGSPGFAVVSVELKAEFIHEYLSGGRDVTDK